MQCITLSYRFLLETLLAILPSDADVSAFALVPIDRLMEGYDIVERASFIDVIQVTKVLFKSLLQNVLPISNEHRRVLTVNDIKSLSSSHSQASFALL